MSREHGRQALALLLSLLIHMLLLSLTFGGQGPGLPGFGFPWRDRRIEVPDLRIVLVPTDGRAAGPAISTVAGPWQTESIKQPVASRPAPTPSVSPPPPFGEKASSILPAAQPTTEVTSERNAAAGADPGQAALRASAAGDAAPPQIPEPAVIDVKPSDGAALAAPAADSESTSVIVAAPSPLGSDTVTLANRDASDIAQERFDPQARERPLEGADLAPTESEARRQAATRQEAAREEAARLESERQEAERQEAARQEAARREAERVERERQEAEHLQAARQDAARQEAERAESERQEAQRQEAARREAERVERERQEAERQEAARQEAARREAERVERERQEAERQEAARQEAARREAERVDAERREADRQEAARREAALQEAARVEAVRQTEARQRAARIESEQKAAARREEVLRAIGRQLDEEAARREAASTAARSSSTLPLSLSTARRARLWGRADPNAELIRYAEAWERKIHLNTPIETVREVAKRPRTDPMVTVAIRSNGSVESVTFVRSSGVAEVDEAIRRIVQSHEHYPAFPPALAAQFDVIEIRRTWHFDVAVRLY